MTVPGGSPAVVPTPVFERSERPCPMLRDPWVDARAALESLAADQTSLEAVQATCTNPETGAHAENILGFYALMLRPGQTLRLPARSPAMVFHPIEGGVEAHIGDQHFQLAEADTCCAPGHLAVTLGNASADAPASSSSPTKRRCTASSACSNTAADRGGSATSCGAVLAPLEGLAADDVAGARHHAARWLPDFEALNPQGPVPAGVPNDGNVPIQSLAIIGAQPDAGRSKARRGSWHDREMTATTSARPESVNGSGEPQPEPGSRLEPRTIPPAAPFIIVLNHGSGKKDTDAVQRIVEETMRDAGRQHELIRVTEPKRIAEIAANAVERAKAAGGVVVAAGGDGTINAVAQATLGSGRPFGVLPQGTFNYFSRTHGIPADTAEATRLLLTARAHPAQVGLVNDRVFLVNASLGLYPRLLEDREGYKRRWGRSRPVAMLAALITVWRGARELVLDVQTGEQARRLSTSTLIVANNQLQLEQMGLPEAEALQRGRLAAISLQPVSAWKRYGLLLRAAAGRLGGADEVERFVFGSMTVAPRRTGRDLRLKVATDGEVVWMAAPLTFRVAPQPLMLLRPEDDAMVRE